MHCIAVNKIERKINRVAIRGRIRQRDIEVGRSLSIHLHISERFTITINNKIRISGRQGTYNRCRDVVTDVRNGNMQIGGFASFKRVIAIVVV